MIYNLFIYTKSPEYENEIENFLEANCVTFDDIETNRHEHFEIHQNYIKLIEKKLQQAMDFLGISERMLYRAL